MIFDSKPIYQYVDLHSKQLVLHLDVSTYHDLVDTLNAALNTNADAPKWLFNLCDEMLGETYLHEKR